MASNDDESREQERRAGLEAAYRRERDYYLATGKTERAEAVVTAAHAELGIHITPEADASSGASKKKG